MSAGAPPPTPLGSLQCSPIPTTWISGGEGKRADEGQGRKEERKENGEGEKWGREGEIMNIRTPPCQNPRSATV